MNIKIKLKHTRVGIELVRKLFEEGKRIFTLQDARRAAPSCGVANGYVLECLHHLVNTGWIVRLKRGLYLISSSFPGMPPVHEFEVAMALVHPAAISHWSAMHFHGMTDQISRRIYVTTTRAAPVARSASGGGREYQRGAVRKVNDVVYVFVRVKPERFFGTREYWIGESKAVLTDPERTLLDGLRAPKYCGDWAEVYSAFESYLRHLDVDKMIAYALRFDAACAKRVGWVLERLGVKGAVLRKLETLPVRGYRLLDPSGPRKGPCNKKWMIQENVPGRVSG